MKIRQAKKILYGTWRGRNISTIQYSDHTLRKAAKVYKQYKKKKK